MASIQQALLMASGAGIGTGIIDPFTSGLWGAYALVRLRSAYSGSAIRVRRSSDNTEQDIGFSGDDLDTAGLASFVGANDAFVVTWYDQSGGANNFGQATSGLQPKIVDAGTYLTEICWDGTDDQMVTANNSGTPTAMTAFVAGRSRYCGGATSETVLLHSGAILLAQRSASYADDFISSVGNGTGSVQFDEVCADDGVVHCMRVNRSGALITDECALFIDGAAQSSVAAVANLVTGNFTAGTWTAGSAGGTSYSKLTAKALLIYETAVSDGDIATISALVTPTPATAALDGFTTNLWSAYSLRQQVSAYAGSCIRVRRSSDNAEADIGFDVDGFMDEAALLTHVGANSGFVTTFYDQAGSARDMVQATAANQPRIVNAGVVDRGVTFDGSNDFMGTAGNSTAVPGLTLFFRGHHEADANGIYLELGENSGTVAGARFFYNSASDCSDVALNNAANTQRSEYLYQTTPAGQVLAAVLDRSQVTNAAQIDLYAGGKAVVDAANSNLGSVPGGNFAADNWYLGGRSGGTLVLNGDVHTAVIYEAAQSAADIERISRRLG
jgi:hypothetical protein